MMNSDRPSDTNPHPEKTSSIFRQEALNWSLAQEKLDSSLRLVRPQDWIALTGLGTMVVLSVLWGIFGKIPISVSGRGVLVRPGRVVEFQAPLSGQIQSIEVGKGQCVDAEEVLATIEPRDLTQKLQVHKATLTLQKSYLETEDLAADNLQQEMAQSRQEIAILEQQIAENSLIRNLQAGCILEIKAAVGQQVSIGTPLGILDTAKKDEEILAIAYLNLSDGKRVKPSMKIQITPDLVSREQFGSIIGTIVSVSQFPVSLEGATVAIGNPQIAREILGPTGGKIEVVARLHRDAIAPTGYQWSSSVGPYLEITPGTTTTARIILEQRSPLSFIFPSPR